MAYPSIRHFAYVINCAPHQLAGVVPSKPLFVATKEGGMKGRLEYHLPDCAHEKTIENEFCKG